MNDEMESLTINYIWTLVNLPKGCKTITCKWIYKLKEGLLGLKSPRSKARLVAKTLLKGRELITMRYFH